MFRRLLPPSHALRRALNARRGVAVKLQDSVEHEVRQEAERAVRQNRSRAVKLFSKGDRFGQQIEKCHADDRTCAESKDKVKLVAQRERQPAARHGAQECRAGNDYE